MGKNLLIFIIISFLTTSLIARQGEITLKNNSKLEGDITREGNCTIIELGNGSIKLSNENIKSISFIGDLSGGKETDISKPSETCRKEENRFIKILKNTKKFLSRNRNTSTPYDTLIHKYSDKYGIDPALIKAVIKVESNFDPQRISHKGASGLMQIMPETARFLSVKNIFDPEQNIHGGIRFLFYMLQKFKGNLSLALAAYNAGPYAVEKYKNSIPPYFETKCYVKDVLANYKFYKQKKDLFYYIDKTGHIFLSDTPENSKYKSTSE